MKFILAFSLTIALFIGTGCSALFPGFDIGDVQRQTDAIALELKGVNGDMEAILAELKRVTEGIKAAQKEGSAELLAALIEEGQALALLYEERKGVADKLIGAYRLSAAELKDAKTSADYMEWILGSLLGLAGGLIGMGVPSRRKSEALSITASNVKAIFGDGDPVSWEKFKRLQDTNLSVAAKSMLRKHL